MRVWIERLQLGDFRNYHDFELHPEEGLTVLVGPNAVGKTNVIEALQLVTQASSFRTTSWSEVVRQGTNKASVIAEARRNDGGQTTVSLTVENGKRAYRINGSTVRALADVTGRIPSVIFTPDDLRIVKESAERRRSAVDTVGAQTSKTYARLRADYDKVLRQRNALLREPDCSEEELEPWTEQLSQLGGTLTVRRRRLVDTLTPHIVDAYATLSSGETLRLTYETTVGQSETPEDAAEALLAQMKLRNTEERARRTSVAGPHKDDVRIELQGRDARQFASQGQQRTISLALKLAELELLEELTGATPVLLLDDVMSELDEGRRHALARRVGRRTQTIMTTTNLGYFDDSLLAQARVVALG